MKQILKKRLVTLSQHAIEVRDGLCRVAMPADAEVLHVGIQNNGYEPESIEMWYIREEPLAQYGPNALGQPMAPIIKQRRFAIVATGDFIHDNGYPFKYHGTVWSRVMGFEFHVIEILDKP
jgi:hypothetical protein